MVLTIQLEIVCLDTGLCGLLIPKKSCNTSLPSEPLSVRFKYSAIVLFGSSFFYAKAGTNIMLPKWFGLSCLESPCLTKNRPLLVTVTDSSPSP